MVYTVGFERYLHMKVHFSVLHFIHNLFTVRTLQMSKNLRIRKQNLRMTN